jgi:two-component system chemotaxis response regulator CheY
MSYDILIVDDSATTRAIIRRAIQMADIPVANVHEAENGQLALDVVAAHHVDVVLADLHMPQMDGVELTRRLLADPATKDIPVVIISAEPDQAKIDALKQQGARGYLRKPFRPEGIRDVINQVLTGGIQHA